MPKESRRNPRLCGPISWSIHATRRRCSLLPRRQHRVRGRICTLNRASCHFLIYDDHTAQRQDLRILPLETSPDGERRPIPFLVTQADEWFAQFSPDGKWIAYTSDESGRREVYVQGFAPDRIPAAAVGKWQISTAGGEKPRWRPDGTELYYLASDRKLMAVPVKIGPTFEPGVAVPLFETNVTGVIPYDVGTDGRFLINTISEGGSPSASPATVILNWQAGLKR